MLAARRMMIAAVTVVHTIVDTFNRANSSTGFGTTSDGHTWTARDGTGGISSNHAVCVTPGSTGGALSTVPGTADGYVEVVVPNASGNGPVFRYTDNVNFWSFQAYSASPSFSGLYHIIAGSNSKLLGVAISNGDLVHVAFTGSHVEVFVNGVSQGSVTDTFNQTATLSGIFIDASGGTIDDFACTTP